MDSLTDTHIDILLNSQKDSHSSSQMDIMTNILMHVFIKNHKIQFIKY